jgi:NOL1/NOP2/fmu family ribosome biogenesis protein
MTPASRLPVEEGDKVLDLCAAPGGKATELAAKLRGTGLLAANDISPKRAKALLKNIELFGVENSFIVTEYPQKLQEYFTGFFDKILIDAPCSGEGMFRKDPSMVKAWEQNGPEFYAGLQEDILKQALPMLKPGGMLLYSTCTFSPLEDEGTVEKILAMDTHMQLLEMKGYEGFASGRPELIGSDNEEIRKCIRIFPHKMDGEGHFLALFKKSGEAPEAVRSYSEMRAGLKGEEKKLFEQFAKNLNREFEPEKLESKQGMVYYMPSELPKMKGLRFLRSGLFLGEIKKKRFEPSQSLAMALKAEEYKNCLFLSADDERVLRYLKGETLTLTDEECSSEAGWQLVCADGYPLGWGKRTGAVLKNKYHSGWRLM